jgi:hypothetical protein
VFERRVEEMEEGRERDLNWHSSTMKAERIEAALALESLVPNSELCLAESECVAKVETSIHVWIWECGHM